MLVDVAEKQGQAWPSQPPEIHSVRLWLILSLASTPSLPPRPHSLPPACGLELWGRQAFHGTQRRWVVSGRESELDEMQNTEQRRTHKSPQTCSTHRSTAHPIIGLSFISLSDLLYSIYLFNIFNDSPSTALQGSDLQGFTTLWEKEFLLSQS